MTHCSSLLSRERLSKRNIRTIAALGSPIYQKFVRRGTLTMVSYLSLTATSDFLRKFSSRPNHHIRFHGQCWERFTAIYGARKIRSWSRVHLLNCCNVSMREFQLSLWAHEGKDHFPTCRPSRFSQWPTARYSLSSINVACGVPGHGRNLRYPSLLVIILWQNYAFGGGIYGGILGLVVSIPAGKGD